MQDAVGNGEYIAGRKELIGTYLIVDGFCTLRNYNDSIVVGFNPTLAPRKTLAANGNGSQKNQADLSNCGRIHVGIFLVRIENWKQNDVIMSRLVEGCCCRYFSVLRDISLSDPLNSSRGSFSTMLTFGLWYFESWYQQKKLFVVLASARNAFDVEARDKRRYPYTILDQFLVTLFVHISVPLGIGGQIPWFIVGFIPSTEV